MAAVTQTIPNYLGGVSAQTDRKKLPGQVRECLNALPDTTFGLMKRPGFKWIKQLNWDWTQHSDQQHNTADEDLLTQADIGDAKWFFIRRNSDESYIGCILDKDTSTNTGNNPLLIWNTNGDPCGITYTGSPEGYLDTTRDNYDVLTVQDTTIITNKTKTVAADSTKSSATNKRNATIFLKQVKYATEYKVTIKVGSGSPQTFTHTTIAEEASGYTVLTNTAKSILKTNSNNDALKQLIDAESISNLTVTALESSLELVHETDEIVVTVTDDQGGENITAFREEESALANLPAQSITDRKVMIRSDSTGAADPYYVKFTPLLGTSGDGYWGETVGWDVSNGLDDSTMPHELQNTALNAFTFSKIAWSDRLAGDATSNPDPSFVGKKIQQTFFHNNRLGILSEDNVILSSSGSFYNFYGISVLTPIDSDPIDMSCSSTRPTRLNSVLPTAQGLILFSENQQFVMFSDSKILTPSTAVIRGISNYEVDPLIPPVDDGVSIKFTSETPNFTRVFGMTTRGNEENPLIFDVGKVVSEWLPSTITNLTANTQNSIIALYGGDTDHLYLHKTHVAGDRVIMQAWFKWILPGKIQFINIESDTVWSVVQQNGIYNLISADLSQSPDDGLLVNLAGNAINPYMDMYAQPTTIAKVGNDAHITLPYRDFNVGLEPVLLVDTTGSGTPSGYTITPTRPTGQTHTTDPARFEVIGDTNAISNVPKANILIGYKYNYDIELPKTYYKKDQEGTMADYTAALTIARMKFAVGLSSEVGFKLKRAGYAGQSETFTGDSTNGTNGTAAFTTQSELDPDDNIIVKIDGAIAPTSTYNVAHASGRTTITFTAGNVPMGAVAASGTTIAKPAETVVITTDTWYDTQPVKIAGGYLLDDVPLKETSVFTVPIHQRPENFELRVFSNSPFPISLTSMTWEGQYSPRYYRRT